MNDLTWALSNYCSGFSYNRSSCDWYAARLSERSGCDAAPSGRSLTYCLQCLAPPHELVEHEITASNQVFVIVQGAAALDDSKIRLHRDIHLLSGRHHLQF